MRLLSINGSVSNNIWIVLRFDILIVLFNWFHSLISCCLQLILLILLIITNVEVLFLGIYSSFLSAIVVLTKSGVTGWRSPLIRLNLILGIISELKLSFSEIQSCLCPLIESFLRVTNFMSLEIKFSGWHIGESLFSRPVIEILHFRFDHLWRIIFVDLSVTTVKLLFICSNIIGSFSS
jgi:hypothetical protein